MFRKRKHTRVAVDIPVQVHGAGLICEAHCVELGAGGMSLVCSSKLHLGHSVQISFSLPSTLSGGNLKVKASVCWARENENAYGVRFDVTDDRRLQVKRWIDDYLQI